MVLDGFHADDQLGGYLAVRHSTDSQPRDRPFTGGQVRHGGQPSAAADRVQAARGKFDGAAFMERGSAELPVPGQCFLEVVRSPAAFPLPPQQPPHGVMQKRLVEEAACRHRMLDAIGEQAAREIRVTLGVRERGPRAREAGQH